MAASRVKELYRRLGPVLFARANRAVKDPGLAERLTKEVTIELARLGELDDAALLKRGRLLLAARCREHGTSALDSLPLRGRPRG